MAAPPIVSFDPGRDRVILVVTENPQNITKILLDTAKRYLNSDIRIHRRVYKNNNTWTSCNLQPRKLSESMETQEFLEEILKRENVQPIPATEELKSFLQSAELPELGNNISMRGTLQRLCDNCFKEMTLLQRKKDSNHLIWLMIPVIGPPREVHTTDNNDFIVSTESHVWRFGIRSITDMFRITKTFDPYVVIGTLGTRAEIYMPSLSDNHVEDLRVLQQPHREETDPVFDDDEEDDDDDE